MVHEGVEVRGLFVEFDAGCGFFVPLLLEPVRFGCREADSSARACSPPNGADRMQIPGAEAETESKRPMKGPSNPAISQPTRAKEWRDTCGQTIRIICHMSCNLEGLGSQ